MPRVEPPPNGGRAPEHPGAQIVRWLRPAGCVLVLLLGVLMVVVCLTQGRDPVPGYAAPHDTAYYAQHLDELARELNENVLPQVDETASAAVEGQTVTVTMASERLATTRAAVLRYFDSSLFVFTPLEAATDN